jgi:hypothetical protein
MNEQIKELADRLWRVHPSDIDAMGLKTCTEFYEHELKKFAELIVRECMDVVLDKDGKEWAGYVHVCREESADMIKKHFGVEE